MAVKPPLIIPKVIARKEYYFKTSGSAGPVEHIKRFSELTFLLLQYLHLRKV